MDFPEVETVAPDLKFLMDREGVNLEMQTKFYAAGIVNLRQFAAFCPSVDELRKSLLKDFGVDPESGLPAKVLISKIVVAWEAARARSTRLAEAEADAEIRQEAKPVRGNDFKIMKSTYEARWWKLEKEQVPARSYIEKVSEGIEQADPRAEALTEVVNVLEGEVDILKAVWEVGGSLKAVKTTPSVPLPRDPEELRARIGLLGRAWAFVAFAQPNCKYLQGNTPQIWNEYLDYLLGPHCYKLYARDAYGSISSTPPWNLVLSYELEVRRKMVEIMARGVTIDQALDQARKDPIVKERHFVTPLAIGATTGKRSAPSYDPVLAGAPMAKKPKGPKVSKGKGKGKGKGKEKGKSARQECASTTPDGKKICFRFNDQSQGCTRQQCTFLHVCGRCFRDHPLFRCDA